MTKAEERQGWNACAAPALPLPGSPHDFLVVNVRKRFSLSALFLSLESLPIYYHHQAVFLFLECNFVRVVLVCLSVYK